MKISLRGVRFLKHTRKMNECRDIQCISFSRENARASANRNIPQIRVPHPSAEIFPEGMDCGNLYGTVKAVQKTIETKKLKDVCEKAAREWAVFCFASMFWHVYMQIFKAQHVGKADKTGFILHFIYIMYII